MESTRSHRWKEFDAETERHVQGYYEAERTVQKYLRRIHKDNKEVLRAWRTDSLPDEVNQAINPDTSGHIGKELEILRPRALAYERAQNKKIKKHGKEEHNGDDPYMDRKNRNGDTRSNWRSRVGMMNISNDNQKRRNLDGSTS